MSSDTYCRSRRWSERAVTTWSRPWTGVFCSLVEAKGSETQLANYAAVLTGVRRALDDWIPVSRLGVFCDVIRHLGLTVVFDCIFCHLKETAGVAGVGRVPTTRSRGLPFREKDTAPA